MTEPRKTPRTEAERFEYYVSNRGGYLRRNKDGLWTPACLTQALEIETQELAEALGEILSRRVREYESKHLLRFSSIACEIADKALARHRAKQEGSK